MQSLDLKGKREERRGLEEDVLVGSVEEVSRREGDDCHADMDETIVLNLCPDDKAAELPTGSRLAQ